MKKLILIIFLIAFLSNQLTFADAPVIDFAAITKLEEELKMLKEQTGLLEKQKDFLESQKKTLEDQYKKITGNRGLGDIHNDAQYKNYLPDQWKENYTNLTQGGSKNLTPNAQNIYNEHKVYNYCLSIKNVSEKNSCEAQAVKGAQDQAYANEAYDKATARMTQIDQLMNAINNTDDPKGIAELQARISIEQAAINNEQTKMQLFKTISENENKVQEQHQKELDAKTWSPTTAGIHVEPITFGNH